MEEAIGRVSPEDIFNKMSEEEKNWTAVAQFVAVVIKTKKRREWGREEEEELAP